MEAPSSVTEEPSAGVSGLLVLAPEAATAALRAATRELGEVAPSLLEVSQHEAGNSARAGDGDAEDAQGKQDNAKHRDEDGDEPRHALTKLSPLHKEDHFELQAQLQPEISEASPHSGTQSAETGKSQEHLARTADEPTTPVADGGSQEHFAGKANGSMAPVADRKRAPECIDKEQVPLLKVCCWQSGWC